MPAHNATIHACAFEQPLSPKPKLTLHLSLSSLYPSTQLQIRQSRHPPLPNPPHLLGKLTARNPLPPHAAPRRQHQRRVLVRVVERILQQPDIRSLHSAKHNAQLRLPKTNTASNNPRGPSPSPSSGHAAPHIDYGDELDARVRLEAVRGQALVHGMQEAEIAAENGGRGGRGSSGGGGGAGCGRGAGAAGARFEDVEGAAEEEGELQGRAQGGAGVARGVVGGEYGYVEGVVISPYDT